jgi:thiol-disulfide isomerase/thioredoxin
VQRVVVSGALVLGLFLSGCSSSGDLGNPVATDADHTGVGTTQFPKGERPDVPDLAGATVSDGSLNISSLLGDVVVLNAWASWCEPCRDESPALGRISRKLAASGVSFVGLDEEDTQEKARAFAAKTGMSYPHLFDHNGDLLKSLRLLPTSGIPSTLVLDRNGKVAARVIGAVHESEFERLVRSVAAESAPTSAGSTSVDTSP